MSERTEWDDAVDEAIEQLIADETEGFVLATTGSEDVHVVEGADVEDRLLATWALVEATRREAAAAGERLTPGEIVAMAGTLAENQGLLQ